jgi:small-conductance mechanosensitive channel
MFKINSKFKKIIGIFFVIFGFIGIITPFTPWGILFFVGLELLGFRFLFLDKIKNYLKNKK